MRNLLVAQSGGPTAAINATLAGVFQGAIGSDKVDHIYGAVNGIQGVLEERFVDLRELLSNTQDQELLSQTPAAALGSCRLKLKDPAEDPSDFEKIISTFKECGYDGNYCTEIFQIPNQYEAAKGAIEYLRPILDRVYGKQA